MTAPARDPVIKVLLVGSQSVSLAGLRALINNESDMEVVGQREHPRDAAAVPPSELPDVAPHLDDGWRVDMASVPGAPAGTSEERPKEAPEGAAVESDGGSR